MCSRPKGCAIGDVFYADGSCSSVDMYDESKIAIGVVYALSSGKGGMPYSTAVSESQDFASLHGRVISLEYLTVDKTLYVFDPTNPFNNSYSYIPFGLYNTNINVKHYGIVGGSLATGYFSEADMYDGKQNTAVISTTEPAFASCVGTNAINYTKGTADYNKSCTPTAALAAISFYPPNVDSSNALAGAGNWYIPSMGELSLLYGFDANSATSSFGTDGNTGTTIKIVNNTLKTLSSKGLTVDTLATQNHWSSTIVSKYDTWGVNLNNGSRVYSVERSSKIWLRPSLEF
jgi:hypothetical protein